MPRLKQKIVLFIEPTEQKYMRKPYKKKYSTPSKIGNLFTNRFCIDEDAGSELLKIIHLNYNLQTYINHNDRLRTEEGLDLKIL